MLLLPSSDLHVELYKYMLRSCLFSLMAVMGTLFAEYSKFAKFWQHTAV